MATGDWVLVGNNGTYIIGEICEIVRCFVPGMSHVRVRVVNECHVVIEEHLFGGSIRIPKDHPRMTSTGVTIRVETASFVQLSRADDKQGGWFFEYCL